MGFPDTFLWGCAAAAAQIEGGWDADGRTPSIWDAAPKERIKGGETCHTACDHYHLWKQDIALMKEIGINSYRFSLSWSRIIPEEGKINQKGIAFYQDLVRELKRNGIEPVVTLYHWDLPLWVHEKGGWHSEDICRYFAEFTEAAVDALSDEVVYWMPMNEPQCFILNGYMAGVHAPFESNYLAFSKLTEICLKAFHISCEIIRRRAVLPPKIGAAMAAGVYIPKAETEEAIRKARRDSFSKGPGLLSNRWWMDPLIKGKDVRVYGIFHIPKKKMAEIRTDLDFIGLNVYSSFRYKKDIKNEVIPPERRNSLGWVNDGRGLYWTIRFWHEEYGLPVMVTENGMCDDDTVSEDGFVHDEKRILFMKEYLENLNRAVKEGYPVLGYQYWSLLDNFEWAEGYKPRFGLIHVDYRTEKRTLKDSAYYYRDVIRSGGKIISSEEQM